MPRPAYKQLNLKREDYAFFAAFARKLSAQIGIDLTIVQALKKALIQYTVRDKRTDEQER